MPMQPEGTLCQWAMWFIWTTDLCTKCGRFFLNLLCSATDWSLLRIHFYIRDPSRGCFLVVIMLFFSLSKQCPGSTQHLRHCGEKEKRGDCQKTTTVKSSDAPFKRWKQVEKRKKTASCFAWMLQNKSLASPCAAKTRALQMERFLQKEYFVPI